MTIWEKDARQWELVDLTVATDPEAIEKVDPSKIAKGLAEFVKAMRDALKEDSIEDSTSSMPLEAIDVKVGITVAGNLAFVVKGAAEASINLRFARSGAGGLVGVDDRQ
jgi:hypothetical protein